MQIQKGLVKYKDRSDIVCIYGLTEEGRQYYFLDNTSMSNGNIIASTVLVEAIDPVVVASSIGVIDSNGAVVIPFVNKSIKPIIDGFLLVEIANSTTPSVVEANSLRNDPLSATKLVTTSAAIKDKINTKMGADGRFIFNDQFSEATICDYSGNNILDNQYFSFIAIKNNETLYLCKNTADFPVLEYSISNRMFIAQSEENSLDVKNTDVTQATIDNAMSAEEKVVEFDVSDITEKDFESAMDDSSVEEPLPVEPSVVDPNATATAAVENNQAVTDVENESSEEIDEDDEEPISVIPEEFKSEEVAEVPIESVSVSEENTSEDIAETPVESVVSSEVIMPDEVTEVPVESVPVPEEVIPEAIVEAPVESTPVSEEVIPDKVVETPVESVPVPEEVMPEEAVETSTVSVSVPEENTDGVAENVVNAETDSFDEAFNNAINDVLIKDDSVNDVPEDKLMEFDFVDDNEDSYLDKEDISMPEDDVVSEFKNDLFDVDLDSNIFAGSTLKPDRIDIDDSYSDFGYKMVSAKDSIIEDVASTMSNLIRQNKNQRQIIASYEEKMDQAATAYKKVVDKARAQLRDAEVLKNKLKNYEAIVTKLEAKLEVLENKVRDQDKVIASQTRELESLRPQVEGREELVRILADAQSLLDN